MAAQHGKKHEGITRQVWSDEALDQLNADIEERRRGSNDLIWDEVAVSEPIAPVVKGPLSITETVAFVTAWGGPFLMASELGPRYGARPSEGEHPRPLHAYPRVPAAGPPGRRLGRGCGFPDAYDFGGQRLAWLMHAVTNWMGDNARLVRLDGKLPGLNLIGDATWCTGAVSRKFIDERGDHCVELALKGTNQRGQVTTIANAVVVAH